MDAVIELDVLITYKDKSVVWGKLSIPRDKTLEDTMDGPMFIPVQILDDRKGRRDENCYKLVLINKNTIAKIEEK